MYRLLDSAAEGRPGHGPAHLLVESAAEIGFQWDSRVLGWERPGLPILSNLAGPIQHARAVILEAWRNNISRQTCVLGRASAEALFGIFQVPCSSLTLAMFGREIRLCLGVYLLDGFGMVFFW